MFQHCSPATRYRMPSNKAVRINLHEDPKLQDRTPLSREKIIGLLSLCLNTIYFTFRGVVYKQEHGAAMGSPVSPIIANLYMEGFEEITLRTAPNSTLQCGSGTWTIHLPWSANTTSMSSLPTSAAWTPTSSSQLSQSKMADCPS